MTEKKFKIGIPGWKVGDNSFGVTLPYLHHISQFGNPVILAPTDEINKDLDLVILPGGKDTLSFNYGRPPGYFNNDADAYKEYFFKQNLPKYIEAGIPIFGTCLGFQQIVIHFNGILKQHIDIYSHGYSSEDRGELVHKLIFTDEWKWYEEEYNNPTGKGKKKKDGVSTCSLHHQGVMLKDVPEELEVIAHTQDKIVEVIRHKFLPIAGAQSHVEEDGNPIANWLIYDLLKQKRHRDEQKLLQHAEAVPDENIG